MRQFRFSALHPVSFLVFFTELLITCFYAETAGLLVIFALLFVFALLIKKAKTVLWALPLAGFMLLLNPIFYHGGKTVLFTLWGYNFTLEAVLNGLYSALLILCTMLIFSVIVITLSEEKFLYVFGRFFPKLALMISMIFKHFDILSDAYTKTKNMAKMNGIYENDTTLFQKLKTASVIFEAFTGAALEGSIDTALSLAAKGYYSKTKTVIKRYHYKVTDAVFLLVSTGIFVFTFFESMYISLPAVALLFCLPIFFGREGKTA
ncbi:MAG: hypothetical protein IJG23_00125 [Clostridia bacterium]|nr:hypothetical protein [Clostridia bacterium]